MKDINEVIAITENYIELYTRYIAGDKSLSIDTLCDAWTEYVAHTNTILEYLYRLKYLNQQNSR